MQSSLNHSLMKPKVHLLADFPFSSVLRFPAQLAKPLSSPLLYHRPSFSSVCPFALFRRHFPESTLLPYGSIPLYDQLLFHGQRTSVSSFFIVVVNLSGSTPSFASTNFSHTNPLVFFCFQVIPRNLLYVLVSKACNFFAER